MPVKLFFCYAGEDESLLLKLKKHLKPLQHEGIIDDLWYKRDISAGAERGKEIDKHLNTAQIILLLVSPDFMNSDYCYGTELARAFERDADGKACVIPIILRPVSWQGLLGKFQVLPKNGKPVKSRHWRNMDEALTEIAQGIRETIDILPKESPADKEEINLNQQPHIEQTFDTNIAVTLSHEELSQIRTRLTQLRNDRDLTSDFDSHQYPQNFETYSSAIPGGMIDPISIVISAIVGSAPYWFPTLRAALWNKGKELALEKGKDYIKSVLDEKKHRRHVELALQNAAERGLRQWYTPEDRDRYRSILAIVADAKSETLRLEAMQLFTLSDNPDLTSLTERYNLSHRITALAHHTTHTEVNATPYLQSFFAALLAALYEDPLFRDQISDVIRTRLAIQQSPTLVDILATLNTMQQKIANDYSLEQLQKDLDSYLKYIEGLYRPHRFAGIVFGKDKDKTPELDSIFVPLRIAQQQNKTTDNLVTLLNRSSYMVLLGGPGSGKSISTRYLAWSHAKANLVLADTSSTQNLDLLARQPVPLLIEMRLFSEVRKSHPGYGFLSYVTKVGLKRANISIPEQMFVKLLEWRALFVLFDGLDEVPSLSERYQLVQEIENFAEYYPGNYILVTSRPVGYELAGIMHPYFQHAEIQEFDDEQIDQFLTSWYTYVLKLTPIPLAIREERDLFYTTLTKNSHLRKLAVNPLLLTVMTALHRHERLPDKRVLIYEKCADLLLNTWIRLKYEEKTRWEDMKMGKRDQLNCIAYLGFVLHERSQENANDEGRCDFPLWVALWAKLSFTSMSAHYPSLTPFES